MGLGHWLNMRGERKSGVGDHTRVSSNLVRSVVTLKEPAKIGKRAFSGRGSVPV